MKNTAKNTALSAEKAEQFRIMAKNIVYLRNNGREKEAQWLEQELKERRGF